MCQHGASCYLLISEMGTEKARIYICVNVLHKSVSSDSQLKVHTIQFPAPKSGRQILVSHNTSWEYPEGVCFTEVVEGGKTSALSYSVYLVG